MKPGKRRFIPKTPLSKLLVKIGQAMSSIQVQVEPAWHVVENLFRHRTTRYRGLAENPAQLLTLFGMANLM
jgi:IS5 family transposase